MSSGLGESREDTASIRLGIDDLGVAAPDHEQRRSRGHIDRELDEGLGTVMKGMLRHPGRLPPLDRLDRIVEGDPAEAELGALVPVLAQITPWLAPGWLTSQGMKIGASVRMNSRS